MDCCYVTVTIANLLLYSRNEHGIENVQLQDLMQLCNRATAAIDGRSHYTLAFDTETSYSAAQPLYSVWKKLKDEWLMASS